MNKTKIATAFAVILSSISSPIMANSLDELNQAAEGLEELSLEDLLSDAEFDILDLESDSTDKEIFSAKSEMNENKEVENKDSKVSENSIFESKNIDLEENPNSDLELISFEEEKEEMKTNPEDLVFLRYVPEGTRLTVNKTFKILPKKSFIILHKGERVLSNPQTQADPEKTFCHIELKASGKARILKSGKQFQVVKAKTVLKEEKISKSYGNYILRTQQVHFKVNNENVKSISCTSADMFKSGEKPPTPLMIKDLKEQAGDIFKIEYPAYEEI